MALAGAIVLFAVVLALAVVFFTAGTARSAKEGGTELVEVEGPTATYRVPECQDPVALVSALHRAGYDARQGEPPTPPLIHVVCPPEGRDELRRAIQQAPVNLDGDTSERTGAATGPVRFTDE